jgi:hypothetical protein
MKVVSGQVRECDRHGVQPVFPSFNQMVVISEGVENGMPLQGVRYPSPPHMSGWWLSTEAYDGNIKSLRTVHYYHVTFSRPELVPYFALPHGFRFSTEEGPLTSGRIPNLEPTSSFYAWAEAALGSSPGRYTEAEERLQK